MLSGEEIKLKIEALEHEALKLGDADGAAYRQMALAWRLLAVEDVFLEAIRAAAEDAGPEPEAEGAGTP